MYKTATIITWWQQAEGQLEINDTHDTVIIGTDGQLIVSQIKLDILQNSHTDCDCMSHIYYDNVVRKTLSVHSWKPKGELPGSNHFWSVMAEISGGMVLPDIGIVSLILP